MKRLFTKLYNFIETGVTYITDRIHQRNQETMQQQISMQNQSRNYYASMMQQDIQKELCIALQGSHYSSLHPIYSSKNIRINGFTFQNNACIFTYRLAADNIPARSILDIIRGNLNTDIYQCQQDLIYSLGMEDACILHPYLFYGLYVIGIYPDGTDICIQVATNYYP